jgi:hypothetical protein
MFAVNNIITKRWKLIVVYKFLHKRFIYYLRKQSF